MTRVAVRAPPGRRFTRSAPGSVTFERSESETSESDREEHTADRIAEKLGLSQFLRRRNKKRGGRGRDRGEAAPKRARCRRRRRSRARCWCHRCVDGATERRSWPYPEIPKALKSI